MAIKSKSFLRSKGLKAICVLLVLALTGVCMLSVCQAVDLANHLGGRSLESILQETDGDFTSSSMFQQLLAKNLYYMHQMAFVYHSEEAVRDGSALKEQEELLKKEKDEKLQEEFESLRQEKEEEAARQKENDYNSYDEYGSIETTAPSSTEPTRVELTEEEEAEIRREVEYQYNEQLRYLRMNFEDKYREAKTALSELVNLHYLLVNQKTGEIYTNLEGRIDPKTMDLRSLVEQYQWNESYTEQYRYHSGERVDSYSQQTVGMWVGSLDYDNWAKAYQDRVTLYEKEFVNQGWDVYVGLNDHLESSDEFYSLQTQFRIAKNTLPSYLIAAGVSFLLVVALAICLIAASGRRAGTEEITLIWTDRIPKDLHLILSGALIVVGVSCTVYTMSSLWYPSYEASSLGVVAAIASAMATMGILLEWLTSVARNLKRKQFWRNTLLAKLFRFFKKNWRRFKTALHHLKADIQKHAIPKHHMENLRISILFLFIGYLLGNIILMALTVLALRDASYGGSPLVFLFFGSMTAGFNLIVLILFWKSVIALDEMMTAVSKTRQGDLSYPLTPSKMPKLLRKFGEDIIGMQEGMRTAVDEAIKGEHMKTELITNVSHDLKTPLTAIVNYVDLLKKCEISDETAREYIGVLEEKSERLKHLIEDLVEASKATTGNVKLNFVRVNLYELAMQAMGENADALEAAGLDVRLNQPEQEPILFADSQKTWRIIDNLISNVKKYALAGTRVYIEVGEENGAGVFAIKNVSREPLDVPIEQLTQRFVRGDASRSTEGSGLGLSIAQSLCELQSGTLEITMDGDLFKVTVRLPLADR